MAHAVWGAVAAQMSGGNAAAGAAGAFSGELAARYIAKYYYHATTQADIDKLSQSDRQEISLLSTLAAGVAGATAGNNLSSATTGAQAGKNAVENNALGVTKSEELIKAIEDQKAGKNLVEASKTILRLTNEDRANNILIGKYLKGELTETEKQELAGQLNQYGLELQILYGYSPQRAAEAVQGLLAGTAFMASTGNIQAYNEALSYLRGASTDYGQAAIGTDVLLALPGAPGVIARGALAAGGAYQAGYGIGLLSDGNFADGALNVGFGSAAIFGGIAGQNIINKAENALTKGQVTYEFGAKARR
ncbi:hypothetical protein FS594_10955 [Rahnella aquatilis]|nr:hypothetical protein FS594_10955 [Rahnella aquatilis]